jgi:OOP family OmpA-OmpF porin
MSVFSRAVIPVIMAGSVLSGCSTAPSTSSESGVPLNSRTWPVCSLLGGLVGGGLGAIESGAWAGGGAALGLLTGGLICFAQDGDQDSDGVFDRRDRCPDTPANTPVSHNGCPLPIVTPTVKAEPPAPPVAPPDEVITLRDAGSKVLFEFDQANLSPEAYSQLQGLLPKLKAPEVKTIKVVGHTDSVGSDEYNQKLSERRAASVVVYLEQMQVDAAKLSSEGKGEAEPIADNESAEGRAQNRRVELHLGH